MPIWKLERETIGRIDDNGATSSNRGDQIRVNHIVRFQTSLFVIPNYPARVSGATMYCNDARNYFWGSEKGIQIY